MKAISPSKSLLEPAGIRRVPDCGGDETVCSEWNHGSGCDNLRKREAPWRRLERMSFKFERRFSLVR